ncbi:MAG: MoaD/ThiS family protein [Dehalococcoidia bacterium]
MPRVQIPRAFQTLTGGQEVVTAGGRNVRQLIHELDARYPGLQSALMEGDRLKPDVRVALDGTIGQLGALDSLEGVQEVLFLPAMNGG